MPKKAIIKLLSLADIEAHRSNCEIFAGKIPRLHRFRTGLDPHTDTMDSLKALPQKKLLNSTVTKLGSEFCLSLSKWIVFLGLTPKTVTDPKLLYCAIYWVVSGWVLELNEKDSIEAFDYWCFCGARSDGWEHDGFYQRAQAVIPDLRDAWVAGVVDAMKARRREEVDVGFNGS